jgi:uncharacterized RDD family membrane protein YckC
MSNVPPPPPPPPPAGVGGPPPPPGGGYYATPTQNLAEWWQRLLARLIDGIILLVTFLPFGTYNRNSNGARFEINGVKTFVPLIIALLYFGLMHGLLGKTVGKLALGLTVVKKGTNDKVELPMAFVRALIEVVMWAACWLPWLLSCLWPLWDKERRSLADMVASTQVIKAK